jgi:hypothetical protein
LFHQIRVATLANDFEYVVSAGGGRNRQIAANAFVLAQELSMLKIADEVLRRDHELLPVGVESGKNAFVILPRRKLDWIFRAAFRALSAAAVR